MANKTTPLEPLLTKKEAIRAIYNLLGKTMGIDAITRGMEHAPYRVFPGGKHKHYRLSEVRTIFEHLLAPVDAEAKEEGRGGSLHRARKQRVS